MIGTCAFCNKFLTVFQCTNRGCGFIYCGGCAKMLVLCPRCGTMGDLGLDGRLLPTGAGQNDAPPPTAPLRQDEPPTRSEPKKSDAELAELKALKEEVRKLRQESVPQGPACPHCGGTLPTDAAAKQYRICQHCRNPLHWVGRAVLASEEDVQKRLQEDAIQEEKWAREEAEAAAKKAAIKSQKAAERDARSAAKEAKLQEANQAITAALGVLGVTSEHTRCTLHTNVGPLVLWLCRDWSEKWTLWFVTAIQQGLLSNAEIFQITPFGDDCEIVKGWLGGASLRGVRSGSYIHLRPTSRVKWPVSKEVLATFKPSMGRSAVAAQAAEQKWKIRVQDEGHDVRVTITNDPKHPADLPLTKGGWVGYLDQDASGETLVALEALPVDFANGDCPTQPAVIERAFLHSATQPLTSVRPDEADGVAAASPPSLPAEIWIDACAVMAATDGKLSPEELSIVTQGLSWAGLPDADLKEKFLSKCRQVFKDGPDKWAVDVKKAIAHARLGKQPGGLQALLEVLASLARCGSGDAARKEGFLSMFRSATKSVISDRPRA
jgi:hypothetical protein